MITATFKTTPAFDAGIQGLIQKCRINSKVVVAKETGELIKMLVKLSPPKNLAASKEKAASDVRGKFDAVATGGGRDFEATSGGHIGATGIKWYSVDERFLRGVAPQSDMRKRSAQDLYRMFRKITRGGRLKLAFKHPRKRQRVLISTKILATKAQVSKVAAIVKDKFGRLKAGWCVAVAQGVIKIYGANMPPGWVTKHFAGARGTYVNQIDRPDKPAFTIVNQARGIGNPRHGMKWIVDLALKARAASMKQNALLFMRGKKKIADYAR